MAQRIRMHTLGLNQSFLMEDWEPDAPAADQVLVRVEACGVCYRDLIDREGRFPWIQLPITPGHEAVGRVIAVGAAVTTWKLGDRVGTLHRNHCGSCDACLRGDTSLCPHAAWVFGLIADGAYATHLLAPANALFAMPLDAPGVDLCALHCTAGTAFRGLTVQGKLSAGQSVLITGANGGVGAAGIQVARRLGARVTAVVRRPEEIQFAERQGASEVLVDDGTSFHRKLAQPVDVVLDCVGSPTFNSSLRALRMGGNLVVVGNVIETKASLNLGFVIVNGLHLHGSSGATGADMQALLALHAAAPLDLPALRDRVLPLSDADAAQQAVRAGGLKGRIVLECG